MEVGANRNHTLMFCEAENYNLIKNNERGESGVKCVLKVLKHNRAEVLLKRAEVLEEREKVLALS